MFIHQVALIKRQRGDLSVSNQAATCPRVYLTQWTQTVPLIPERPAGKL